MTLVRVNPNRRYRRNPSFFTNFVSEDFFKPEINTRKQPAVNVLETADGFQVEIATPGLSKKDIGIKVEKEVLSIFANVETASKAEEKVLSRGFSYSNFKRSFQLPDTVNSAGITANYKNGILSVSIPKKEEAKELPPRTIEIK